VNRSNIRLFSENETVIKEGVSNREMYRIVSGKAALYFDYGTDSEYLIGVLGEGRCFGEIGLLTGKPSPFSVIAFTDLMLLGVGADDFSGFIREEPDKAADIMKNLAGTVVTMSANINMLKDEMLKVINENSDANRVNELNKTLLKYRVSGLQGSPYFTKLS
jgi:CRP-like cAMP-binding protein